MSAIEDPVDRPAWPAERASALMLAPALVLVLAVLGGLAVDTALVHSTQRDLYRRLSAAADDAAGMVDQRQLQLDGTLRLDPAAARRVVLAHLGLLGDELGQGTGRRLRIRRVDVVVDATTVVVTAAVEVPRLFLAAVPGVPDRSTVEVRAEGRLLP